jgi:cardiolipin synthase
MTRAVPDGAAPTTHAHPLRHTPSGRELHFLPGNRITLLQNGTEYFPALEQAFDQAQHEISLETYIYEDDTTGRRIAAALMRAAQRGVTVRVLLDGFGSKDLPQTRIEEMREAGVQLLHFRPEIARWKLRRHRLRRLHRKLVVVDGRLAFVGGINIINDLDTPGHTPPRFDYAVAVEGPLLAHICPVVTRLWALVTWTHFRQRWGRGSAAVSAAVCGDKRAAFVVRDNLRHRRAIEDAYLDAIAAAQSEIIIANAYFLPGVNFRHALVDAAARGVRVTLLLQGRVEYLLLHYASRALYGSFLAAGIEIHEYHRSFMHAKVAVIDGRWATVGSSNIDPFSLLLSREANVVVDDPGFSGQLRDSLAHAMAEGARPIQSAQWKQQPLALRLLSWFSYGAVRFLMGMVGYGRESRR